MELKAPTDSFVPAYFARLAAEWFQLLDHELLPIVDCKVFQLNMEQETFAKFDLVNYNQIKDLQQNLTWIG